MPVSKRKVTKDEEMFYDIMSPEQQVPATRRTSFHSFCLFGNDILASRNNTGIFFAFVIRKYVTVSHTSGFVAAI